MEKGFYSWNMHRKNFLPETNAELLALQAWLNDNAIESDDTAPFSTAFFETKVFKDAPKETLGADHQDCLLYINDFLRSLSATHIQRLANARVTLKEFDISLASKHIFKLLTQGISCEPEVFESKDDASQFIERLIAQFGNSSRFFTNAALDSPNKYGLYENFSSVFLGPGDAGIILVSPQRVGILWFFGYD